MVSSRMSAFRWRSSRPTAKSRSLDVWSWELKFTAIPLWRRCGIWCDDTRVPEGVALLSLGGLLLFSIRILMEELCQGFVRTSLKRKHRIDCPLYLSALILCERRRVWQRIWCASRSLGVRTVLYDCQDFFCSQGAALSIPSLPQWMLQRDDHFVVK